MIAGALAQSSSAVVGGGAKEAPTVMCLNLLQPLWYDGLPATATAWSLRAGGPELRLLCVSPVWGPQGASLTSREAAAQPKEMSYGPCHPI